MRALSIFYKDTRLALVGGSGILQAILQGLLLIFLFSLSREIGVLVPAQASATIFWLASIFSVVLIFANLFSYEETNNCRVGLLSSPIHATSIWLGKFLSGFLLLFLTQCSFFPASIVFLQLTIKGSLFSVFAVLILVDMALASIGVLIGALTQGKGSKESLFSVILFPLLLPVLLAGIRLFTIFFAGLSTEEVFSWASLLVAFVALFLSAGMVLFPSIYNAEE